MADDDISMESSELKRREMDRDDGRDAISNLPDSVLLLILSFLPTRDAVRTVMVPRFRYLWTSTRHLSFDHCAYHNCKEEAAAFRVDERFVNFTDYVLTLHENPTIDSFRLNMNYAAEVYPHDPQYESGVTEETRRSNKISTWIRFAARRKVKFLDLNFLGCAREFLHNPYFPHNLYLLPSVVLRCSCLVELKLASCEVGPVGRVQLRSLRKLFMKRIDLTDNKMADILSGSLLLKELSLEECDGLHEPKFCSGLSIEVLNLVQCGGLNKLDLTRSDIKHLIIGSDGDLELVCPNVKILDIAGCLNYVKVTDMSSLVDTSLCFRDYFTYPYGEYCEFRLLLEKLSCSSCFMPCDLCILLTNQPCPSFAWKHVTLQLHLKKRYLPGISSLLRNSHFLETLTIYVYPGRDEDESKLAEARWKLAFGFNGFSNWSSVDSTFPCLEHRLKHVKIYGYVLEPDVIELIEFLLKNAQVLEKMEISTKKTLQRTFCKYRFSSDMGRPSKDYCTSDELLEFSQKLLRFPRASTRAVIHLG